MRLAANEVSMSHHVSIANNVIIANINVSAKVLRKPRSG